MEKNRDNYIENEARRLIVRWERIRNHPIYLKKYDQYILDLQKAGKDKKDVRKKWGQYFEDYFNLLTPINPEISFLHLIVKNNTCLSNAVIERILLQFRNWSKGAFYVREDGKLSLKDVEPLTKKALKNKKLVDIAIDIEKPKTRILNEVESIIDQWLKLKENVVLNDDKRLRTESDIRCFEIYNLRKRKRMAWSSLARKFHDVKPGGLDYAIMQTKRQYKRAINLILGVFETD